MIFRDFPLMKVPMNVTLGMHNLRKSCQRLHIYVILLEWHISIFSVGTNGLRTAVLLLIDFMGKGIFV